MSNVMKKISLSLLVGLTLITSLNSMKPAKVSAWTGSLPNCAQVGLQYWDWPKAVREIGTDYQGFSPESSKYVIGRFEDNPDGGSPPAIKLMQATGTGTLTFNKTSALGQYELRSSTSIQTATINDGPKELYPTQNYTLTASDVSSYEQSRTVMQCIYTAKGVVYGSAWDQATFNNQVAYKGTNNSCTALEFGCWIGKAFNGIENTFLAVGQAIVRAFAFMWAPDSVKAQTEFDGLKTFLTNKLGFLTYPFTFAGDVFTAMGSTANNWCNNTSCEKNFGTILGTPVIIKFDTAKSLPTLWNAALALIRGVFVLGLLFIIFHKYQEITSA